MTTETARLVWRAAADLIEHGSLQRSPRTLCGKPVTLQRFAWPKQRRCNACTAIAKAEGMA